LNLSDWWIDFPNNGISGRVCGMKYIPEGRLEYNLTIQC